MERSIAAQRLHDVQPLPLRNGWHAESLHRMQAFGSREPTVGSKTGKFLHGVQEFDSFALGDAKCMHNVQEGSA